MHEVEVLEADDDVDQNDILLLQPNAMHLEFVAGFSWLDVVVYSRKVPEYDIRACKVVANAALANAHKERARMGLAPNYPVVEGALLSGPRQAFVVGMWEHEYLETFAFRAFRGWKKHGDRKPNFGYVKVGNQRRCVFDLLLSGPMKDKVAKDKTPDSDGYTSHACVRCT